MCVSPEAVCMVEKEDFPERRGQIFHQGASRQLCSSTGTFRQPLQGVNWLANNFTLIIVETGRCSGTNVGFTLWFSLFNNGFWEMCISGELCRY